MAEILDLDEELLADAKVALGTSSRQETVTRALRKAVEDSRERRLQAFDDLQRMTDEGAFDFDRLAELDR